MASQVDGELQQLASQIGVLMQAKNGLLATAESCTGGWVAQTITAIAGSSLWFDRGFVTYSNSSKCEMLGVSEQTLADFGAVSEAVVMEMARGVLMNSHADVSVAITGIAGPSGGSEEKPVGTVWIAWGRGDRCVCATKYEFQGTREAVRAQAVKQALQGVLTIVLHPDDAC